jgi:hypothetical protein
VGEYWDEKNGGAVKGKIWRNGCHMKIIVYTMCVMRCIRGKVKNILNR